VSHSLALRSNGTVVGWGDNYVCNSPVFAGQASIPLGLTNVVAIAAGDYHSLALTTGTIIVTQPIPQIVDSGQTARFEIGVRGKGPFSFQWRQNGSTLQGATNSTLALTNVQPSDAGAYSVAVSNTGGYVVSLDATLTVVVPPTISEQPEPRTKRQILAGRFYST